jgi:hypothetical protein
LKTEIPKPLRHAWHALTEIPGWPDAPLRVRFARFFPILVPCLGLIALTAWRVLVHDAEVRTTRDRYTSLLDLEQQVESLSLACSEQEAVELRENARRALQLFAQQPDDIRSGLAEFTKQCRAFGWEGSFQSFDIAADEGAGEGELHFVPVLGKLTPAAARSDNFLNLVRITELVFNNQARMDLTRLQIHADGSGSPTAEMGIRIGMLNSDEKAAQ